MPRGAPEPAAPPWRRQRRLPLTAGARQGWPARVRAPQRGAPGQARRLQAGGAASLRFRLRLHAAPPVLDGPVGLAYLYTMYENKVRTFEIP